MVNTGCRKGWVNKMLKDVSLEFSPTEKGRECPDNKGIYGLVAYFVHAMPLFS